MGHKKKNNMRVGVKAFAVRERFHSLSKLFVVFTPQDLAILCFVL